MPETEVTPIPAPETNREKLYRVAKSCLGREMSPLDIAPDTLACVESLNGVFKEAFGTPIATGIVGTSLLYAHMLEDSRFKEIPNEEALPGDIRIYVTGQSEKGAPHGHVLVLGKETAMSNDSNSTPPGLWHAHYTLPAMALVFEKTLGFPPVTFRVV